MDRETRTAPPLAEPPASQTPTTPDTPSESPEPGPPRDKEPQGPRLQVRDPGRYQIIAEHGRGGVGRVMRAADLELGRDVALKELLKRSPMAETRFLREALVTSRLEHPNVVPVHEAGRWPDGTPFYAMKLVSGRPLAALIDEAETPAARLALLDRVLAVTDAISYAHDRGVIHRDLKPSNVIVGDYGETIVIDWGLAKSVSDPDDDGERSLEGSPEPLSGPRTKTGAVLGTPAYMAPEQAFGGAVTTRTDIHALGAILSDVLAGRTRAIATRTLWEAGLTEMSGASSEVDRRIPAALRSIAARATAASPWDRYASAKELGDDLRRFLAGGRVAAHRYTPRERVSRWLGSHRRLVQGAATALVALLAASIWFLARETRLREEADVAREEADVARHTAESERDRADRQTIALLEQQGRAELAAGHPFRAAPILAEAYRRDPGSVPVRWMLTESLRALDGLHSSFRATLPGAGPDEFYTYSVSFSPDDSELVIGHRYAVSFWDSVTGQLRRQLSLRPLESIGASYSSDGRSLLLTLGDGEDSPARVVDTVTGAELAAVPAGADADCVSWSRDGRYLASLMRTGRVDVWSVSSSVTRLRSFDAAPRPVFNSLAMSPDGSVLAARGAGEVILATPAPGPLRRLALPGEDVQQLVFSPDSRRLLATLADRSARVWEVATGHLLAKLRPQDAPPFVAAFSADGSVIATADIHSLHLWDTSSTIEFATFELQSRDPPYSAEFDGHGGSRLATVGHNRQVRTWDLPRDRWVRPLPGHRGRVRARYLGRGGARIVTADEGAGQGDGARLRIWNAATGELESSAALEWDPDCDLAVTIDGDRVALLGRDGAPTILDPRSGRVELVLPAGGRRIRDLDFSPDGHRLGAATADGAALFWSARDGGVGGPSLRDPAGDMWSLRFSPDGRQLMTSGARIWDSSTGRLWKELGDSLSGSVSYSLDGRRAVTNGHGGDVPPRVWDVETGNLVATLEQEGLFLSVAFSPDGSLVAGADEHGNVAVWDAARGTVLRSIRGPTEASITAYAQSGYGVEFSPDGKRLLASGPGYALLWNVELDRRSPAQVDAVVAAKSPWHLVDARLSPREP